MPVTLSIKNAPDDLVAKLKQRAAQHHRSLQGELMSIIERAAWSEWPEPNWSVKDIVALAEAIGPRSPSSVEMIREDRDR